MRDSACFPPPPAAPRVFRLFSRGTPFRAPPHPINPCSWAHGTGFDINQAEGRAALPVFFLQRGLGRQVKQHGQGRLRSGRAPMRAPGEQTVGASAVQAAGPLGGGQAVRVLPQVGPLRRRRAQGELARPGGRARTPGVVPAARARAHDRRLQERPRENRGERADARPPPAARPLRRRGEGASQEDCHAKSRAPYVLPPP